MNDSRIAALKTRLRQLRELIQTLTDEHNQHAAGVIIKNIKYLLYHIRFRNLKGHLRYGSDDPAAVGTVFGFMSLLYPKIHKDVQMTPVFDQTVLDADLQFHGHIRLIHLLIILVRLLKDKDTRTLILKQIMEGRDGRKQ